MIASTLLVARGLSPFEATERVSSARHVPVPETVEQSAWIESFAAALNRRR
jgi:hypothetical protein